MKPDNLNHKAGPDSLWTTPFGELSGTLFTLQREMALQMREKLELENALVYRGGCRAYEMQINVHVHFKRVSDRDLDPATLE